MDNKFKIGDRVICVQHHIPELVGSEHTVVSFQKFGGNDCVYVGNSHRIVTFFLPKELALVKDIGKFWENVLNSSFFARRNRISETVLK